MSFLEIEVYRSKKDPAKLGFQLFWLTVLLIIFIAWAV